MLFQYLHVFCIKPWQYNTLYNKFLFNIDKHVNILLTPFSIESMGNLFSNFKYAYSISIETI